MQPVSQESRERFAHRGITSRLYQIFTSIDTSNDDKIDCRELATFLKKLGYGPDNAVIANMVWEVDEDHDGKVGWKEFERAYERCSNDTTGTEPRQLYNVVQFLLHISTREDGGAKSTKMTVEDATRLMYLQHGRDNMDAELEATFGKIEKKEDLTLEEFLRCMTARDVALRPRKGRKAAARGSPTVRPAGPASH